MGDGFTFPKLGPSVLAQVFAALPFAPSINIPWGPPVTGTPFVIVHRDGTVRRLYESSLGPHGGAPWLLTKPELKAGGAGPGTWAPDMRTFYASTMFPASNDAASNAAYMPAQYTPAIYREPAKDDFIGKYFPMAAMALIGAIAAGGALAGGDVAAGGGDVVELAAANMDEVLTADILGLSTPADIAAVEASITGGAAGGAAGAGGGSALETTVEYVKNAAGEIALGVGDAALAIAGDVVADQVLGGGKKNDGKGGGKPAPQVAPTMPQQKTGGAGALIALAALAFFILG